MDRRRTRNRSSNRKNRPFPKIHYQKCAIIIQRLFRKYLRYRYSQLCKNHDDDDCISLVPISEIPRDLLVIVDEIGYCATGLCKWTLRSNRDPLTRKKLPDDIRNLCVSKIQSFLISERNTFPRKGFFSKRRKYIKLLKVLKNDRREINKRVFI